MFVQIGEREIRAARMLVQVVEAETGEVGDEDVAREIAVFQAGEIVEGLAGGAVQVLAPRLVLDQQHPFPEQVDETAPGRPPF